MKTQTLLKIVESITQFLEGKIVSLNEVDRKSPRIFHYYYEIIRYLNRLNFIMNKTIRSLSLQLNLSKLEEAFLLFIVYMKTVENQKNSELTTLFNKLRERAILRISKILFQQFLERIPTFSWKIALKGKSKIERLSIREAYPSFLVEKLLNVIDLQFLKENLQEMNKRQPTYRTFRINNLNSEKSKEELLSQILTFLKINQIKYKKDPHLSEVIHISSEYLSTLLKSHFYEKALLIPQNEASVAVIDVLSPEGGEFLLDICAAPGMKTSLISQYLDNGGLMLANEFLLDRTFKMKSLLNNFGVKDTLLLNADGICFPIRKKVKFDKILLDAPCTGSGTLRKNPELKWRQNRKFLFQNVTLQKKLLESCIKLLKPNGVLVYSTCSLYPEENELIIRDYLNLLEPMEIPNWFSPPYTIDEIKILGTGRLFPSIHHSEGFFIGKFKKKGI
ncbi:MAG: tRNA (Cytosine(48)-C(5))-methyltransferase [Promethearchaeota archaeon]|nr:MAG: tRNA (Cytosine(48)-C(5))-methyltransferase [Candidatus Lokiarchaeota archaeon]